MHRDSGQSQHESERESKLTNPGKKSNSASRGRPTAKANTFARKGRPTSIKSLRASERRLRDENQRLRRSLRGLAHDLAASLWAMDATLGQIQRESSTAPLATVASQVECMASCLAINEKYLRSLQELARHGVIRLQCETVDLASVIAEAVRAQGAVIARREARVTIGADLPPVRGDAMLVGRLFTNVLCNALVHGCDATDPVIDVTASKDAARGMVTVRVRDNGGGAFASRAPSLAESGAGGGEPAFAPCTRAGQGLAIVKEIVETLGGDFGIEFGSREGTTVWFSLPAPA